MFRTERKVEKTKPQKTKSATGAGGGGFLKPSSKDTPRRGSNVWLEVKYFDGFSAWKRLFLILFACRTFDGTVDNAWAEVSDFCAIATGVLH